VNKCPPLIVPVDSHGIYEFNMSILNSSIPYIMHMNAYKIGYETINMDYFVGGYPNAVHVEMGSL
jgi:hypothetical protein